MNGAAGGATSTVDGNGGVDADTGTTITTIRGDGRRCGGQCRNLGRV